MSQGHPTILVTGCAGFIGSHVAQALLARGDEVVGIDNFDSFYQREIKERNLGEVEQAIGRFDLIEADIRDARAVDELFGSRGFNAVIHLAARAGVRPSIAQPALYADVNVRGTSILLDAAQRHGCDRFILASSSSVYGNNDKIPFAEEDDVSNPISPYAATKRSCELLAHAHHHLTGMPTACLRFFTVFGPRQRPDLAISRFMDLIARGIPEAMFGDGSVQRDFTYIDEIVDGVLAALDRIDAHGCRTWNLGGNSPRRMDEVIETIARVVGRPSTITKGDPMPGDALRTYADISRSAAELGFRPRMDLEDGIRRQWEWYEPLLSEAPASGVRR